VKDCFQLPPAFARFVFVHIKIILVFSFEQTLSSSITSVL
jgi:hypothetical protein